jgi:hypothetical protein
MNGKKELLLTCFCESLPGRNVAAKPNDRDDNSCAIIYTLFYFIFSVTALLLSIVSFIS